MRKFNFLDFMRSANTVIIFTAGLLFLFSLLYAVYQLSRDIFGEHLVTDVINTESSVSSETEITLGSLEPLVGTNYLLSPVTGEQDYRQDYYDKGTYSTRNYLFLNVNDRSARYLLTDNQSLLLRIERIFIETELPTGTKTESKVVALWYEVINQDTNGDDRLTDQDERVIALSDVSGENYQEVIKNVDRIFGWHQKNDTTILLMYQSKLKNWVSEIDLRNPTAIVSDELPALKPIAQE